VKLVEMIESHHDVQFFDTDPTIKPGRKSKKK
jgi:hypothetical protein